MTHDEKLIQAALDMAADVAMDRAYRLLSLAEDAERGGNFALGDRIRVMLTVAEDTAASVRSITPAKVLTKVGRDTARRDHLTNGPARLWMREGTSAPWFVKPAGNSTEYVRADLSPAPDAVAGRPCTDCGHTHDTDGDLCPTCVCVRAEIAAMETDHD